MSPININMRKNEIYNRKHKDKELEKFTVVCDETNNSQEDIDQKRMNVDIIIRDKITIDKLLKAGCKLNPITKR